MTQNESSCKFTAKHFSSSSIDALEEKFNESMDALSQQLTENYHKSNTEQAIVSEEQQKERLYLQIKEQCKTARASINKGLRLLLETVDLPTNTQNRSVQETEEIGTKGLAKLNELTSQLAQEDHFETIHQPEHLKEWSKEICDGKNLKEVMGFSEQHMEAFFDSASNLYLKENFDNAVCAFRALTVLDAEHQGYWIGLALSLQFSANYPEALNSYYMAMSINENNPWPYFYYAECLCLIKEWVPAKELLNMTQERIQGHEELDTLLERIKALRACHPQLA